MTPEQWDALVGRRFYSSSAWLDFCSTDFGSPSAAVFSSQDPEAALAVPVVRITEPVSQSYDWNAVLAYRALPGLAPRGLLVGPREGYQTHILGDAGQRSVVAAEKLVRALRDRAAESASEADRACVAMYLTTPDVLLLRAAGVRAHPVLLEADAWIEIPAGGWSPWLESLPAKRRVNIRGELRRFQEAGYRIEDVPLSDCYRKLAPLAVQTQSKYGFDARLDEELSALRNHAICMGEAARVTLCSLPGEPPAGFCLYYHWKDTIFLRWAGFDYARLASAAEYFNIVYYSHIRRAADSGVRWLHAGIKSTAAKVLRGARLRPLWLVDLGPDSPLEIAADDIKAHNSNFYERLLQDRRVSRGVVDRGEWEAFL